MKLTEKQKRAAFAALRRFMTGPHWEALNERRSVLIDCEFVDAITADSLRELEALQALASLRRDTLAPLREPMRLLRRRHSALPNAMMSGPEDDANPSPGSRENRST